MILNNKVQILTKSDNSIELSIDPYETVFHFSLEDLVPGHAFAIGEVPESDQLLAKTEFQGNTVIIYIKNNKLLASQLPSLLYRDLNLSSGDESLAIEYETYIEEIAFKQTSETSVSLFSSTGEYLYTFDDILAYESPDHVIPLDLNMTSTESRYILAGKIVYEQFNIFLVYDLFRKEMITRNRRFQVLSNNAELEINLESPEIIQVSYKEDNTALNYKVITKKARKIFDFYQVEDHRNKHMLASFSINGAKYFIFNRKNGVFISKGNALEITGYESRLHAFFSNKHLYIYGRNTHYAYKANGEYDYLYITGKEEPITKFTRPVKSRFFRRFGFFKVPISCISKETEQKQGLYLGDRKLTIHPLKLRTNAKKGNVITIQKRKNEVLLLNAAKRGSMFIHTSFFPEDFTLKNRIRTWISGLKNSKRVLQLFKLIFTVMGRMPKKRKLVIFESFHAKQYSDSPRAIYEYMKKHHSDYELVWSIDRKAENLFKEFGVPYIRRFTISWFLNFPRAKYWVNNVRLPAWMPKPKDTVYIQTWHGTPLKKLGIDITEIHMPGTNTSTYKNNFITEARKWDYLVSPNPYSTEIFRRAFHYPGKIIESGYPRNDVLSMRPEALASNLKQKLGIPADKKIMLYAPTWRDNEFYEKGKYKFEFQFDLNRWKQEFGDEWVLLSRMHYLVAENFDFSAHEGTVYDASSYPDIRDLYLISDLMITDYSSVFFDFAVLERPIIFFMYDLEQYRDQLRGFYIDIEEDAPGPIVETEEELFRAINELKGSNVLMNPKFSVFKDKFSSLEDGHAAERVVKAFLE
ncbi:CDP-glycerol glycerophosphotransferase family protein [Planococcus sp. X10-3]|uniref:CDP-glycerol glycerophosphotransferase family protein n=1 Tax=Planococcus sp. X10-3 TaxID=3061240 RepID=UPI003BB0F377